MRKAKRSYQINKELNLSPDKCIGFSTHLQPYQIADILNKELDIDLHKLSDLITVNQSNTNTSNSNTSNTISLFDSNPKKDNYPHQFFYYYNDFYRTDYILLQNNYLNNCIIDEFKDYDYLLFIFNDSQNSLEYVLSKSKSIANTFSIILNLKEAKDLKHIMNTLDEIEMHLVDEEIQLKKQRQEYFEDLKKQSISNKSTE